MGTFAQDGCSKLKGKSLSPGCFKTRTHKAMSCFNYMKSQISLGGPHSIEGHHRPALSRLARVPRPASSESAKQQWVCKKMRGHKMPERAHLWVNFAWWNLKCTVVSRSNAWMESSLETWSLSKLSLQTGVFGNDPGSIKHCIPNLALCIRQCSLKVVQPKSCNNQAIHCEAKLPSPHISKGNFDHTLRHVTWRSRMNPFYVQIALVFGRVNLETYTPSKQQLTAKLEIQNPTPENADLRP